MVDILALALSHGLLLLAVFRLLQRPDLDDEIRGDRVDAKTVPDAKSESARIRGMRVMSKSAESQFGRPPRSHSQKTTVTGKTRMKLHRSAQGDDATQGDNTGVSTGVSGKNSEGDDA